MREQPPTAHFARLVGLALSSILAVSTSLPSQASAAEECLTDFDGNGSVNMEDFDLLARTFAPKACLDCVADADRDGDTDIWDFHILSVEFGRTDCPIPSGPRVLVLHDGITESSNGLVGMLKDEGLYVRYSGAMESEYDGQSPALDDFDVVIHLNGNTYDVDMPAAGQQALDAFVRAGGGYIGNELTSFAASYFEGHYSEMSDLRLFEFLSFTCGERSFFDASERGTHPVADTLDGASLSVCSASVDLRSFPGVPTRVLMVDDDGLPAVATRRVELGQVVGTDLGLNFVDGLFQAGSHPDVQQLYLNTVLWLHSIQPGTSASASIGPAGGSLELGELSLDVPPGALAAETEITVSVTDARPTNFASHSPVYHFEPEGLAFALPAELRLPFGGELEVAGLFWQGNGPGSGYQVLPTGLDGRQALVALDSLGDVFAAETLYSLEDTISDFDVWLGQTGYELSAEELAVLDGGTALVGLADEESLPLRHPNGTIEVSAVTYDRLGSGELSWEHDPVGWVQAGLFDSSMPGQVAQASEVYAYGNPIVVEAEANSAPPLAAVAATNFCEENLAGDSFCPDFPDVPDDCVLQVSLVATQDEQPLENSGPQPETDFCDAYSNERRHGATGGLSYALARGGTHEILDGVPPFVSESCEAEAEASTWAKVRLRPQVVSASSSCGQWSPHVESLQVRGSASSEIRGEVEVKTELGSFLASGGFATPYEAKAESMMFASADPAENPSGWDLVAELASECTVESNLEVGVTGSVSTNAGLSVGGTLKFGYSTSCNLDSLEGHRTVDGCARQDAELKLRLRSPVSSGLNADELELEVSSNSRVRAVSVMAAAGSGPVVNPLASTARADTTGSCMQASATSCQCKGDCETADGVAIECVMAGGRQDLEFGSCGGVCVGP